MSSSSLNVMEVAEILNITKNTVYEMIKRGELPSYKVGRKIRIDRADIESYINSQKKTPTSSNEYLTVSKTKDKTYNENEIIISGQDIVLDILGKLIENEFKGIRAYRSNMGSYSGLFEMYHDRVSIASCHLWDKDTNTYNTSFVNKLLPGVPCVLVNIAYRTQGFYVQKGNPKNIRSWEDLNKKNITMVNREKGSGVRILLDSKIQSLNLSTNISGYEKEETSHLGVASYIARKKADVGIGNEKVSKQVDNIDFIPLQKERYDLVIRKSDLDKPIYKSIINIISSDKFKNELEGLGGYDLKDTGKIISET